MSAVSIAVNLVGRNMLGGSLGGATQGLYALGYAARDTSSFLKILNSTTGTLAAGAVGAAAAFLAFAIPIKTGVSGAVELQDKLLMLRQALQANSDAMPVLTNAVNDLGVKTVYSSSEAADAFAMMVRMGFNASQVMYGAGAAANEYSSHAYNATEATHGLGFEALALGQALKINATDGATLAATAVQTFGQEVKNSNDPTKAASGIINDLAGAYLNGAQSGSDLLSFMRQAGPTAASMGVKFKDLVTTGDVLAQAMGGIGVAGMRLRYMLTTMVHPTAAQSKELAFLGITSTDTGAKFDAFAGKLEAAGLVSAKQVTAWKGSQTGLQNLFNVAQKAGMVPLDQNFLQWALSTGMLSSKLYDAQGNFISTKNAVDVLAKALQNKTPEERMQALATLFNVRGGDAGKILTSLTNFDQQYTTIWNRIGKTDVVSMAMQQLDTFKGATQALSDSLKSGLAVAFLNLLPPITRVVNGLNNLLENFLNAPPAVQTAVGVFLLVGATLAGLVAIGLGVAAAISFVTTAAAGLGIGFGALAGMLFGIPAAILAVTAGVTALIVWLHNGGNAVDWIKQHLALLAGLLSGAGAAAFMLFGGHVEAVAGFVGKLLSPLLNVGSALKGVIPWAQELGMRFLVLQQNVLPLLAQGIVRVQNVLGGIWPAIQRAAGAFADLGVKGINLFDDLGGLQGIFSSLWGSVTAGAADLWALVAPFAAVVGVALAIAAVVAGVVIQFRNWWQTSSQFRSIVTDLWSRLQQLGTLLMGQLQQGLHSVQQAMGNMGPTVNALKSAWTALQPVLQFIGGVVIVLLIAAVGLLIAILRGVISAIGPIITMLVGAFAGALQFVAGVFQFLAGVVQTVIGIIRGLFTGDWSGMIAGLNTMKAGAINIWNGLKNTIVSIVTGLWNTVKGLIGGFVGGVIDWFSHLADVLVGHSIVPDMVNSIVQWFAQLPGRVGSAVQSMVSGVISHAGSMASQFVSKVSDMASQATGKARSMGSDIVSAISGVAGQLGGVGRNMIQGLIGGIQSMAASAAHAAASVAGNAINAARNALGINSPSKVFHAIGAGTVEGFVNGLNANASSVQAVYSKTFNPDPRSLSVLSAQNSNAYASAAALGSSGGGNNQPINIYVGNDKVAQLVLDKATGRLKQSGVSRMRR